MKYLSTALFSVALSGALMLALPGYFSAPAAKSTATHATHAAPAPPLSCTPLPPCHGAQGCCRVAGAVVHDPCRRVEGCGERVTCEALPWCPAPGGCCEVTGLGAERITVVAPCGAVLGCAP